MTRKFKGVPTIFRQSHVLLISGIFTFFFKRCGFLPRSKALKEVGVNTIGIFHGMVLDSWCHLERLKNVLAEALPGSYYQASHTFAAAGRRERLGYWCMYVYIYISVCVIGKKLNQHWQPSTSKERVTPFVTNTCKSLRDLKQLRIARPPRPKVDEPLAPSCKARKDVHVQPMAAALQSLPSHSRAILSLGAIGTYVHWWNLQILWNCSWMLQVIVATRWIHTPKNPMF